MSASAQMPRYKSHKEVHALKLCGWEQWDGGVTLMPADRSFSAITIEGDEGERIGEAALNSSGDPGYLVVYEGGYRSWSPTEAFEKGYTRIEQ